MAVSKKRLLLIGLFAIIAATLVILSASRMWIEDYFTNGLYPYMSFFQRMVTGWVPFSIGDAVYALFLVWVCYKIFWNLYLLVARKLTTRIAWRKLSTFILLLLSLYIVFLLVWGLNYSRKGIRYQLDLGRPEIADAEIVTLQSYLLQRVNNSKRELMQAEPAYPGNREIFERSVLAFHNVEKKFPFFKYRSPSIKSSLFGSWWNYMGFTGYYNPFTGEAQINTTVPKFLVPSITLHEMAHQIGYAKENEANFVGFLVGSHVDDPLVSYSAWLDLFMYTSSQLEQIDSAKAHQMLESLDDGVKSDIREWRQFSAAHRSYLEPAMRWVYGKYLKLNNQPQGMKSYDAVVSLVMAYYKKEGKLEENQSAANLFTNSSSDSTASSKSFIQP